MKRVFRTFFVITLVVFLLPTEVMATNDRKLINYSDGSYTTVEIIPQNMRNSKTVSGSKVSSHYDRNGSLLWKVTLTGYFTYTGSSATCTSSDVDIGIYDSSWYTVSKNCSRSGSTAYAKVSMGQRQAGVTVQKILADMSLTCDANGKLS